MKRCSVLSAYAGFWAQRESVLPSNRVMSVSRYFLYSLTSLMFAFILGPSFASAARAQSVTCAAVTPVTIAWEAMPTTAIEIDDSLPLEEIRKVSRAPGSDSQEVKLGFYEARIGSQYDADVVASNLSDRTVCMRLRGLKVQFGFIGRRIWLARELTEYPCIRKHVIAYEHQHVTIDEELLSIFLPELKKTFAILFADGLAATAPNISSAGSQLKSYIESRLSDGRSRFLQLRIPAQMQVDRATHLRSFATECDQELDLLFRRLR